jgi:lipopolysaccharide/colanic/teichoic acid biosynthesis glycosyltransferase
VIQAIPFFVLAAALLVALFPYTFLNVVFGSERRLRPRPLKKLPRVTVVIPAHNEAEVIVDKLYNVLGQDYPAHRLEVIIGDDGSEDETAALIAPFLSSNVFFWRSPQRLGKAVMLNRLLERATGELVLFTDASCMLSPHALRRMVVTMSDVRVGVALPTYAVKGKGVEAGLWGTVGLVRKWFMRRGFFLGVSGAAYMMRRKSFSPLPHDTINDDYTLGYGVARKGRWVWPMSDAVAVDGKTSRAGHWQRMCRIAAGDAQMLFRLSRKQASARVRLSLWVHKGLRLALPAATVGMLLIASFLLNTGAPLFSFGLLSGIFFLSLALAASYGTGLFAHLARLFFAQGVGLWRAANNGQAPQWARPDAAPQWVRPPLRVRFAKRAVDVFLASVGLVLGAPLMAVLALWIRLDSKGPSIYAQRRVSQWLEGERREFVMYKFRSMRADAEMSTGPTWAKAHDPRVTPLGRFMRKTRLDELPQLFNVLKGDMSLVGPRPERAFFVEKLSAQIPGYEARVQGIKPGLTGWAQIHCGYDTDVEAVREKVLFDLAYGAHLHTLRDYLRIETLTLLRTLRVVMAGSNAH